MIRYTPPSYLILFYLLVHDARSFLQNARERGGRSGGQRRGIGGQQAASGVGGRVGERLYKTLLDTSASIRSGVAASTESWRSETEQQCTQHRASVPLQRGPASGRSPTGPCSVMRLLLLAALQPALVPAKGPKTILSVIIGVLPRAAALSSVC